MTPAPTTETKHTEGPWLWRGKSGSLHAKGETPYTYGETVLAPTYEYDSGTDVLVSDADARLIAAAPDLLDALKAAVSAINAAIQMGMAEAQGHDRTAERLDKEIQAARALARVAIAKAVQS